MSKGGLVPVDLLKDFNHVQTTLGFRIGVKSLDGRLMSCVVQQVFISISRRIAVQFSVPPCNLYSQFSRELR